MQQAYDKNVSRRIKIWALHYPVSEIPEPTEKIDVPLSTPPNEIDVTQNQFNENENMPPKTEENNDIKNNDNDNIEGNHNEN